VIGLHQVALLQLQAPSVGVGNAKAANAAMTTASVVIYQYTRGYATLEYRHGVLKRCKASR
jgi:hypothetical protein